MNNINSVIPAPPRKMRRRKDGRSTPTPPPVALMLVAAQYHEEEQWVRLTFDRAIDISALDPAQVVVDDDDLTGNRLAGVAGATMIGAVTVQIPLNPIGSATEATLALIASGTRGMRPGGV